MTICFGNSALWLYFVLDSLPVSLSGSIFSIDSGWSTSLQMAAFSSLAPALYTVSNIVQPPTAIGMPDPSSAPPCLSLLFSTVSFYLLYFQALVNFQNPNCPYFLREYVLLTAPHSPLPTHYSHFLLLSISRYTHLGFDRRIFRWGLILLRSFTVP